MTTSLFWELLDFLKSIGTGCLVGVGLLAVIVTLLCAVRFIVQLYSVVADCLPGKDRQSETDPGADEKKSKTVLVYISTPINGREGATLQEKFVAARNRAEVIEKGILSCDAFDKPCIVISTFDESDGCESEADAMGRCIRDVIDCDIIIVDDSDPKALANSKGCCLELEAARIYKKNIVHTSEYGI